MIRSVTNMGFSPTIKSRAFIATIQIENMKKSGLSEEEYMNPETLAQSFTGIWNESGNNRTSAIAVCESKEGLYHAHMAIYGNPTTLKNAAKILFDSHVEPQLGGKKALTAYMTKEGSSANKGEKVLYTLGIENIMDSLQGKRNIFDIIDADIAAGKTPSEILSRGIAFYRYERIIKKAFLDKKIKKMAIMKELHTEWHCGTSGSGKTYVYNQLCEKMAPNQIYLMTDYDLNSTGGLDEYLDAGAPPILFMDEFKADSMTYGKLLTILSPYSRMQTHCRYSNTYNLWSTCIITCIYPPEEIYHQLVPEEKRNIDSFKQLLRRLTKIVYHYIENGIYKTFSVSGNDYVDYETLILQAKADSDGFITIDNSKDTNETDIETVQLCLPLDEMLNDKNI